MCEQPSMSPDLELEKLRLDYAWKWFVYHADQRLKAFNFMLVTFGFLVAAIGTTIKDKPIVAMWLGMFSVFVALLYSRLDRRNRDLVWKGENILKHLERNTLFRNDQGTQEGAHETPVGILLQPDQLMVKRKYGDDDWITSLLLGKHRIVMPTFAYAFAFLFLLFALERDAEELNRFRILESLFV